ncbi:peptide-methionine (S)-S-oxide reductase MsrA [Bizionia gelidisalsuginis]|uniref:Peptide methionine sulfoxide reductase MsrA n=1 Tax=Bizionia gelidisalsuginis TaxID=291188 RepID=A0ABY3MAT4_9FLAO|nr:peptide-methionine (S)-S-oxide reductase MsrA [Bizionia gelidisalsuginis]TYC12890.1 peptide-methionine (S)-S-oxide reductase MsrA [Bizionia gelidisalsuginis]
MKKILPLLFITFLLSCQNKAQNKTLTDKQNKLKMATPVTVPSDNGMERAYFASGCFWCVEAIYESVTGVSEVISGYAGGHTANPTYESSNTGRTGHAEAVEVIYNPTIVSFETLLEVYFASQNPTQVNGQGPDNGSQYRSIIFYQNSIQKELIQRKKEALSKQLGKSVAAEVYPFQKFWKAEGYHQNYEKLNPNNGYIKNVSVPRLKKFQAKMPAILKKNH